MSQASAAEDSIMHSMREADIGITFIAELTMYFERLSAGGTMGMPLSPAPWGDELGMVTDRFGIGCS